MVTFAADHIQNPNLEFDANENLFGWNNGVLDLEFLTKGK
jgi:hypothetical protein